MCVQENVMGSMGAVYVYMSEALFRAVYVYMSEALFRRKQNEHKKRRFLGLLTTDTIFDKFNNKYYLKFIFGF